MKILLKKKVCWSVNSTQDPLKKHFATKTHLYQKKKKKKKKEEEEEERKT